MATKSGALLDAQATRDAGDFDTIDILDGPVGSGNVLVRFTGFSWSGPTGGNGTITVAGVPLTVAALLGGTASHARMYNAASPTISVDDLTVTATGGGGQVQIDNTAITGGQNVNLTSASWAKAATV